MRYTLLVEKDVAIPVRDGGAVFANVFRPAEAGAFPVIMTLGPYPKDIHFSQWNPVAWSTCPSRASTCTGRRWTPSGGCRRATSSCAATRAAPASRPAGRAAVARRGRGLPRLRRVGGHAALEQRQGRGDGHLVLRDERVARRRAAAAAPGGDRAVGGRGRPVPRREPPRRHLLERLHAGVGAIAATRAVSDRRRREPIPRRCRRRR